MFQTDLYHPCKFLILDSTSEGKPLSRFMHAEKMREKYEQKAKTRFFTLTKDDKKHIINMKSVKSTFFEPPETTFSIFQS